MRVRLDRDSCTKPISFCERCLGRFLQYPLGYERACFSEIIEDDGSDELTLEITNQGETFMLTLNEEDRELIGREGWTAFVDANISFYRT